MSAINLVSVYDLSYGESYLYTLLEQRQPGESISHKEMPSYTEHMQFVQSKPYLAWYLVELDEWPVGAVYLTHQREIGIWIHNQHRGAGHAHAAVNALMALHPGRFLANINPGNLNSRRLFEDMGFCLIQHTYAKE